MHVGHAERFRLCLYFSLVVDIRLGEFVLEKSLVVVPGLFRGTVGQARQIFLILDWLRAFAAALRGFGEEREIKAFDGLAAFIRQFGADAAFVLHA